MTFGEAQILLRNDILAEASTDYFTDLNLLEWLRRAAREIARNYGFPTDVAAIPVSDGETSFSLPSDAAQDDLNEVVFDGFRLQMVPYQRIAQMVEQTSLGNPRYYNFDAKRGGLVYVAPKFSRDGIVMVEYIKDYDPSSATQTDEIWNGLLSGYHSMVVYRAAHFAFDASLENERAQYWLQREQARGQELSAYLNKMPLNQAVGQGVGSS